MIQIKITPDIIARAKKKAASVGILQGSITGSLSNVVGAIGEVIVKDYVGGTDANNKDFDLLVGNKRVDVKTKRCNTTPHLTTTALCQHTEPSRTVTATSLSVFSRITARRGFLVRYQNKPSTQKQPVIRWVT